MRMKMKQKWKRVLVSIMTIAMLASQMTAGVWATGEPEHDHWADQDNIGYIYNEDGTHNVYCKLDNTVLQTNVDCAWKWDEDAKCACGSTKPEETEEHDHWADQDNIGYIYNEDGTHNVYCKLDNTVLQTNVDCAWKWDEDAKCACGSTKPEETEEHDHWTSLKYVDNHNGTHNVVCGVDGEIVQKNAVCVWENGKACICGSECDHMGNNWKYVDNGNGTHKVICADCEAVVTAAAECVYVNGKCGACGHVEPSCDHMKNNWEYVDNGNGTHDVICKDCNEVVTAAAECVYTDGKCICGATECDHMGNHWTYTNNGNGTHKVICADCGTVVTAAADCVYVNGACGACGHKEPGCDHMGNNWEYVDNGNGTHKVICKDCNEVVTAATECVWENGNACVCGSECDHMGNHWAYTDNGNGTHKVTCTDCGTVVTEATECVWENGNACVCGSVEAVETESESEAESESESETESEPVTESEPTTESEPETESEPITESEPATEEVTEDVTEDVTEEVSEKETDKVTEKTTEASKKADTTEKTTDKDAVKTGDNTVVVPYIIVMAMAVALVVVVIKKRKVVK